METVLAYVLSGFDALQQVGTWAAAHPQAAAVTGGLVVELVAKYSPWRGADGLVEVLGKAVVRAAKK